MGVAEWGVGDLYRIDHMTACTRTYRGVQHRWCEVGEAEWGVGDLYLINHVTACTRMYGGTATSGVKWETLDGGWGTCAA